MNLISCPIRKDQTNDAAIRIAKSIVVIDCADNKLVITKKTKIKNVLIK